MCVCVCVCVCVYIHIYTHTHVHAKLYLCPWGFSRQEYWIGLPCPPPGALPNSGIEPISLMSPALAVRFFTTSATWETHTHTHTHTHTILDVCNMEFLSHTLF